MIWIVYDECFYRCVVSSHVAFRVLDLPLCFLTTQGLVRFCRFFFCGASNTRLAIRVEHDLDAGHGEVIGV